jgi:hypothetical protein
MPYNSIFSFWLEKLSIVVCFYVNAYNHHCQHTYNTSKPKQNSLVTIHESKPIKQNANHTNQMQEKITWNVEKLVK